MNLLMVGDVYGEPGRAALQKLLPKIRQQHQIDLAVVNVENSAGGFGHPMCLNTSGSETLPPVR